MMTILDKMLEQIRSVPSDKFLNLIYPQTCGICGKINSNSLCKKCEIQLEKCASFNVIKER